MQMRIDEAGKQQPPAEINLACAGSTPRPGAGAGPDVDSLAAFDHDRFGPARPRVARVHAAICEGESRHVVRRPGLTGGEFQSNWNDLSLGELFERMRISMPQNAPGSLSRQQNADILAYVLFKGNYPTGQTELPTQTEVLNTIKFMAQKPAAQ